MVSVDDHRWVVRTRRGEVDVERSAVIAWRRVPPPPGVPPLHRRTDTEELQRVAGRGWPAVETEPLGDWLLRSSDGWTQRASSVLAVGGPGCSLDQALRRARAWYADRGRASVVQLAEGPLAEVLEPELEQQGFVAASPTLMLTATAAGASRSAPGTTSWSTRLEQRWLDAFTAQRPLGTPAAARVLAGGNPHFARLEQDGRLVALGRLAVDPPWAGISALWVAPEARGRGLGRALTADMAARAESSGCPALYLQVVPGNTAALALYHSLGFVEHHRYDYWVLDETARGPLA